MQMKSVHLRAERAGWLMLERRRHLRGIVNGIDYDVFNPMKDTYLDKHFSIRDLSGKVV